MLWASMSPSTCLHYMNCLSLQTVQAYMIWQISLHCDSTRNTWQDLGHECTWSLQKMLEVFLDVCVCVCSWLTTKHQTRLSPWVGSGFLQPNSHTGTVMWKLLGSKFPSSTGAKFILAPWHRGRWDFCLPKILLSWPNQTTPRPH